MPSAYPSSDQVRSVTSTARMPRARRHHRRACTGHSIRQDSHLIFSLPAARLKHELHGPRHGPDGGRADRPRRAGLRHLFAAAQRARRCSSSVRSTTTWPTWSSRSCCSWSPRIRTRTSPSTSTRPGGIVTAGMAIYDTMQFIKPDVQHDLRRPGGQHGRRCCSRAARRASACCLPQFAHDDPPAAGRLPGPGHRHRHPRPRDPEDCASA